MNKVRAEPTDVLASKLFNTLNRSVPNYSTDLVLAIANGGLVPASYFVNFYKKAKKTTVPMLPIYHSSPLGKGDMASSRFSEQCWNISNLGELLTKDVKHITIIDDVVDTGNTVREVLSEIHKVTNGTVEVVVGCFYCNPTIVELEGIPVYSVNSMTDDYILFDWEI